MGNRIGSGYLTPSVSWSFGETPAMRCAIDTVLWAGQSVATPMDDIRTGENDGRTHT
jgi:hypothetical protein